MSSSQQRAYDEAVPRVDRHAHVPAAGFLSSQNRIGHARMVREVARFLGLVLQRDLQRRELGSQRPDRLGHPLPLAVVIGRQQIVVAVLSHPQIDDPAVDLQRHFAHASQIVERLAPHGRINARDGAFAVIAVAERIGDDRRALQTVAVEALFHLLRIVGTDVPRTDELNAADIGHVLGSQFEHPLGRRVRLVAFAETVAGVAQIAQNDRILVFHNDSVLGWQMVSGR